MLSETFEEEGSGPLADAGIGTSEPEYSFEGYDIEFSEKVMLTPVGPNPAAGANPKN